MRTVLALTFSLFVAAFSSQAQQKKAYDIDMAMEICSGLPLDNLEGVWVYPQDNVTVLILKEDPIPTASTFTEYAISVVQSDDCRLVPGDRIGYIRATADTGKYEISLFTEKNKELFQKAHSCLASLSKDGDALVIKDNKSKRFNLRFNLNPMRLLPGFWKIVRLSVSSGNKSDTFQPPAGMLKIYPSYDGNGSSRRQPRYL